MSLAICIYCDKTGRKNAIFVECAECARLFHRTCMLKHTKMTDREINVKNHEFVPRDYVVFRKDRLGGRRAAGGVLLAIRPHLQPKRLPHLEGNAEIVWAAVRAGRLRFLIGSAYRRPNADAVYNAALLRSLEGAARELHNFDGCLLFGDFNLDIKWDMEPPVVGASPAEAFADAFADLSLKQMIKTPTRTTSNTAKILDLFLCDIPALVEDARTVPGVSDHEATVATLAVKATRPICAPKMVPNYQRADWELLKRELERQLRQIRNESEVSSAWENWKSCVFRCVEELVPKKRVGGRRKKRHPWLTKGLVQLIKIRDSLFDDWKIQGTDGARQIYLVARRSTQAAIRSARDEWLWRLGLGSDRSKELWRYISSKAKVPFEAKSFEIDGRTVNAPEIFAEKFSEVFQSNFSRAATFPYLRRGRQATSVTQQLSGLHISPAHVQLLLQRTKSAAAGPDGVPAVLLQRCAQPLSASLCHVFRLSLESGEIPSDWKAAAVTPIYKDGPKDDVNNYRPVSITSLVGKTLERLVRDKLSTFLEQNSIIPKNQHGFRSKRSCTTLLTGLIDKWTAQLDERSGTHIHAVFLDWSKAFDKVPFDRLLSKLQFYGVRGKVLRWLENFLTGRTQYVKFGGVFSAPAEVLSGVVQGSVLGPLLFNLFVADLPEEINSSFDQYADDTTLHRVVDIPEDADALQEDLDRIFIWCENNGMQLNGRKCHVMDISRARTQLHFEYSIGGVPLEYVDQQRLLGVHISRDLRWSVHTDIVRAKAAQVLGFAARNLHKCTQKVKRVSFLSLVKPILMYGLPAWHPTTQENMTKLERVQKRALRFIYGRQPPPPQETNIMPVEMHLKYTDLNFFKRCQGGAIDFDARARITERRQLRGDVNNHHARLQPPPTRSVFSASERFHLGW
ncbi:Hypothetical predicted protein [Cloeon dipterum]|uniref:Reverse transcriptase domain-containing protein n=1 Tax=Cloeon dipterum TaxID=197152 RepID=A0A8S1DHS0_9INSE|nr:Hypothetical predicted protein [Cloeon dipterum]